MATLINGTKKADTILGDLINAEHIYGLGGNDILSGYTGDILNGGLGDDTLWALSNGVTLIGAVGDDLLNGGAFSSFLYGGVGNDTIYAAANSTIMGGLGADKIIGAVGNTATLRFDAVNEKGNLPTGGITVDLAAGTTSEGDTLVNITKVVTTHLNDNVSGSDKSETIWLGAGNDIAVGHGGNDTFYGGAGNDEIHGGTKSDQLFGDDGDDMLYGRNGNDYLTGGAGNDQLYGGKGNDQLLGGMGKDVLTGGGGADVFIYKKDTNYDTVKDFQNGIDHISIDVSNFSALTVTQVGKDTTIRYSDGTKGTILLEGINATAIGADDFIFI